MRELAPDAAANELVLASDTTSIDFAQVFGRIAPVEVDLGCGDGAFLAALASQHPERNFLGVERLFGRVGSTCRRIARMELANARILRAEIPHTVEQLLAAETVDVFHLLFPDPWPKRRHHVRRVFTPELLSGIARALVANGVFRVATDDTAYFRGMQRVLAGTAMFEQIADATEMLARTTFEQRFTDRGLAIHRLVLRKVSDPR